MLDGAKIPRTTRETQFGHDGCEKRPAKVHGQHFRVSHVKIPLQQANLTAPRCWNSGRNNSQRLAHKIQEIRLKFECLDPTTDGIIQLLIAPRQTFSWIGYVEPEYA